MCAAADRGFTWSDEETAALLKFWGAHDSQNVIPGNKRNFVIYEAISEKMSALGFTRSTSQCREKIKRMKREYTLTKQYNGTTNGPKKLMRFYDQFERILLEKQSRNQRSTTLRARALATAVLDPQQSESGSWMKRVEKRVPGNSQQFFPNNSSQEKDESNPWAPDVVLIEGDEAQSSRSLQDSHCEVSPTSCQGDPPPKKKKKIASRMGMFQSMMDAITTKFMDYQQQTDSKFLAQLEALEHQRQEADENIQKMWLEFEEKRRKEEQDHELRVLSAFKDILSQITVNHISKTS